jgi:hypothetical protein
VESVSVAAVAKLFRTRTVVVLEDLYQALKTSSRTTVFRVLSTIGYHTSYSARGRYYTLKGIPQFDSRGLWHYRDIGFSQFGSLRATLVHLVDHSPAGYTHEELQPILKLRVHDTLLFLVNTGQLRREEFQDNYVYFSAQRAQRVKQLAERQKLVPPTPAEPASAAPGELAPAVLIDLLLDVIRHPEHDVKAVCRQLASLGHWITPDQVEGVFRIYGLKKTLRSRSPRSPC